MYGDHCSLGLVVLLLTWYSSGCIIIALLMWQSRIGCPVVLVFCSLLTTGAKLHTGVSNRLARSPPVLVRVYYIGSSPTSMESQPTSSLDLAIPAWSCGQPLLFVVDKDLKPIYFALNLYPHIWIEFCYSLVDSLLLVPLSYGIESPLSSSCIF